MENGVLSAWEIAGKYHSNQKYGDELPYLYHLGQVYMNVNLVCKNEKNLDSEFAEVCSILHDIIEDTDIAHQEIKEKFGHEILEGIKALTKNELIREKRDQMLDSLQRIKKLKREVGIVKICDRISRLVAPVIINEL